MNSIETRVIHAGRPDPRIEGDSRTAARFDGSAEEVGKPMVEWSLSKSFESPQGRIGWERFGAGRPVLLLHGTPNWSVIWRRIVPSLAQKWQVYVFDWPGFGLSDHYVGQNISWDEQPRRLGELIEHWEIQRPAIVAFDFAAIFVLRAHLFEGLEVGPLVLADAAVIPPFVSAFSREARDNVGVLRRLPPHIAEAMIAAHIATATKHEMPREVLNAYLEPWRGEGGVQAYWRAVSCYDENLAQPLSERLGAVDVPTLVLWGEEDAWLPPVKGEALAAALPAARFRTVSNAGHFLQEDNPGECAGAIAEFLEEVGYS